MISFSLGSGFCLYLVIENINYLKKKYNLLTDSILDLILSITISIITILSLAKTFLEIYMTNTDRLSTFLGYFEYISFGALIWFVLTLIIFLIFSCPCLRTSCVKKSMRTEKRWKKLESIEFNSLLMEFLWKPFWENLFENDEFFFKKQLNINENFKTKYINGKNIPDNTNNLIAMSPEKRLKTLKNRAKKPKTAEQLYSEGDENSIESVETINKCQILMRKHLQHKLEGIDIFWDGEVIGKRSCFTYFGRVISD
jgi:hypothetical protein